MQRIGKKSFTKAKSKLLCYLLSMALALTNLVAMPAVSISAAESTEQGNGNQETLQPKVVVNDYRTLIQAVEKAGDGDIIGISGVIEIYSFMGSLGKYNKKVTLLRMTEDACIKADNQDNNIINNLVLNGNSECFQNSVPMLQFINSQGDNVSQVEITNCNSTDFEGGAILFDNSNGTIRECTFIANCANMGGHICLKNRSELQVYDSTLIDGRAKQYGGAAYISSQSSLSIYNSKICQNSAEICGGGFYNANGLYAINTIIYGNSALMGADFANVNPDGFNLYYDNIDLTYKAEQIKPKNWINDYESNTYLPENINIEKENSLLKLVYSAINDDEESNTDDSNKEENKTDDNVNNEVDKNNQNEDKKDESNKENEGSGKDESKEDATEHEQSKDDGNKEDNNGDNSAADLDSEKENDLDSEKENDDKGNGSTEDKENQDNQGNVGNDENNSGSSSGSDKNGAENPNNNTPNTSAENGNQTSNPSVENPNTGNNSAASDSTISPSEENNQPDSTINNGNQGGASDGNIGSNSGNNNQNPSNKPVSGNTNNTTNGNVSGNTNSGSGSSLGNGNTSDNTSQSGGNVPYKPENNQDNNSDSSDNGGTAAITDNTQISVSDSDDGSSGKITVTKKKAIKKLTITAKKGKKRITGKTIKKTTVKARIGKKTYKVKSNVKGKFTVKLKGKAKLKKGQKIKVTVAKKGYNTKVKIFKVK